MRRGLVIGKFYPPHLGHKFLIDTAIADCDRVDVIVCVRPDQTIPGPLRIQWLREMCPTANVLELKTEMLFRSEAVERISASRNYDLYLRDGEMIREWMTHRFEGRLRKARANWIKLSGSHEVRLTRAKAAVLALFR